MIEHVLLKTQVDKPFSARLYTEVRQDVCAHRQATNLERGPALAAIVALEALKKFWVIAFVRVHMEAQIFLSEEAGAADPAVVGSQEWPDGLEATTG